MTRAILFGLAVGIVVGCMLMFASTAEPHHAKLSASPHLWFKDILFGKTEAPAVHPLEPCTKEKEGEWRIIWDPILQVHVHWACRCPDDDRGCRWFRVAWYPTEPYIPGAVEVKRKGVDRHRTCAAIVCIRHRHVHYWNFLVKKDGGKVDAVEELFGP